MTATTGFPCISQAWPYHRERNVCETARADRGDWVKVDFLLSTKINNRVALEQPKTAYAGRRKRRFLKQERSASASARVGVTWERRNGGELPVSDPELTRFFFARH